MSTYVVIVSYRKPEQMFWTGSRWHPDYPEARLYKRESTACRSHARSLQPMCVVADYGLDTERSIDL